MKKFLFLFLLMPFLGLAQFTVNVTTTPEFCAGDGEAQININNTTNGAVFDFQIYRLPNNTTPYRTVTGVVATGTSFSHTETDLPSGNYSLVAYENIGGTVTQKTASFTITSNFSSIVFNNVVTCDVNLEVNVTQGNPDTFELQDSGGTVVAGPQTSNIFNNLASGTYNVIVTDICGNTTGQSVTISGGTYSFNTNANRRIGFNYLLDCNTIDHTVAVRYNGGNSIPTEKFPINITFTVTGPGGSPVETFNTTWTSNANQQEEMPLPFYYGEDYTIQCELVDACGQTYEETYNINKTMSWELTKPAATCGQSYLAIQKIFAAGLPITVEFLDYPAGFDPADYNSDFSAGAYSTTLNENPTLENVGYPIGDYNNPLPPGTYTIRISDDCGHYLDKTTIVDSFPPVLKLFRQYPGCEDENASLYLVVTNSNNQQQSGDITTIRITSAPAAFPHSLPYDVSDNINPDDGKFYMNGLPTGEYTFEAETTCGTLTITDTLLGKQIDYDSNKNFSCGAFDLDVSLTSRLGIETLFLQRYDTTLNKWVHPVTGTPYNEGENITSATGYALAGDTRAPGVRTISGNLNNITSSGEFRVIVQYYVYGNGTGNNGGSDTGVNQICREVLETFMANPGGLEINDYYVIACADNTYNLIVDATGVAPLTYEIVEKDGSPFSLNNGTDPVFTDLEAGTYKIKVSDSCGNSINVSTRVLRNKLPVIQAEELCDGENGRLYIEGLSFLDIEWYKDGNPTGITGNSYNFTPYNAATDIGLYEAHLSYNPNPNSCIDNVLSFELTSTTENNPNAGTGQTVIIYENTLTDGAVDLFDYLTGPYDTFGGWTEITNSGLLYGNEWYAEFAPTGTYVFEYTVNGTCSNTDSTQVTINFFADFCTQPGDFDNGIGSETKIGITLYKTKQETWPQSIPNGFIALESNSKGFVITRVQNSGSIADPKEGMLIYDKDAACVKLYNGTEWKCIKRDCNE